MPLVVKKSLRYLMVALIVAFAMLAIPRARTVGCPPAPGTLVVMQDPAAGYCAFTLGEQNVLRPLIGAAGDRLCATVATAVHTQAEVLHRTLTAAHDRCAPPPTFTDVLRFYGLPIEGIS